MKSVTKKKKEERRIKIFRDQHLKMIGDLRRFWPQVRVEGVVVRSRASGDQYLHRQRWFRQAKKRRKSGSVFLLKKIHYRQQVNFKKSPLI